MRTTTFVVLMILVAMPVFGDQSAPDQKAIALLGALRKAERKDPYGKLFQAQQSLKKAVQEQPGTTAPKRTVVCGMTMIEVGPSLDPKMGITPPKNDNLTYTIRAIDPPICNSSRR